MGSDDKYKAIDGSGETGRSLAGFRYRNLFETNYRKGRLEPALTIAY